MRQGSKRKKINGAGIMLGIGIVLLIVALLTNMPIGIATIPLGLIIVGVINLRSKDR